VRHAGLGRLWISAVAGGSPVGLLKGGADQGIPGSWSPDDSRFVYYDLRGGAASLNVVRTTGEESPEILVPRANGVAGVGNLAVPQWSPANDWILYYNAGYKLISPDGKRTRTVMAPADAYVFSQDGTMLYGVRGITGQVQFFSVRVDEDKERNIGWLGLAYFPVRDDLLLSELSPTLRLSMTPDGKSVTFAIGRSSSALWLMEGLIAPKRSLLSRLRLW
jgi:hypothetical protein